MNATDENVPPPPPPPGPEPAAEPQRRLTRSTDDKVLTGLCGGLGRYFGVDPVVFRIAFVVLAFAGGTGVCLYLVGWLLIPDDHGGVAIGERLARGRTRQLVLAALAGLGIVLVIEDLTDGRGLDFPLALVLVAIGAAILWTRRDRLSPPPPPPPGSGSGSTPSGSPPADSPPSAGGPRGLDNLADSSEPGALVDPPPENLAPSPPKPPSPMPAARPPRPPSVLVSVTLSILAVLGGTLALLRLPLAVILAVLLLVTGGALVVGAWRGRARWLIPVAIVLGASLAVASVADVPLRGGTGDRIYRPTSLAELRPTYRMAVGELVLDLRALDLEGRTARVLVTDGIGHLEVLVPRTATVTAIGHAGAGEVRLFDQAWDGVKVDRGRTFPGREGGGRIVVEARVGLGQVEVLHAEA
jgi:phage shock protein PspC (stress-responsive transcriptional regulator)